MIFIYTCALSPGLWSGIFLILSILLISPSLLLAQTHEKGHNLDPVPLLGLSVEISEICSTCISGYIAVLFTLTCSSPDASTGATLTSEFPRCGMNKSLKPKVILLFCVPGLFNVFMSIVDS